MLQSSEGGDGRYARAHERASLRLQSEWQVEPSEGWGGEMPRINKKMGKLFRKGASFLCVCFVFGPHAYVRAQSDLKKKMFQ